MDPWAVEAEDTPVSSISGSTRATSISGSGVYGVGTAWVKGDKASKSPVHDAKKDILQFTVKGFNLRKGKNTDWEDIVILRAGHRKVEIHLSSISHSLPGLEKTSLYVVRSASHHIRTDHIGF